MGWRSVRPPTYAAGRDRRAPFSSTTRPLLSSTRSYHRLLRPSTRSKVRISARSHIITTASSECPARTSKGDRRTPCRGVARAPDRGQVLQGAREMYRGQGSAVREHLAGGGVRAVPHERNPLTQRRSAERGEPLVEADRVLVARHGPAAGLCLVRADRPAEPFVINDEGTVGPLTGVGIDGVVGGLLARGDATQRVILTEHEGPPEQVSHQLLHVMVLVGALVQLESEVTRMPDRGTAEGVVAIRSGEQAAVGVAYGVLPRAGRGEPELRVGLPVIEGDDDHRAAVTTVHVGGGEAGVVAQGDGGTAAIAWCRRRRVQQAAGQR